MARLTDVNDGCDLPGRKEILDGMLGANLVCFQVSEFPTATPSSDHIFTTNIIVDLFVFPSLCIVLYPRLRI